MVVERQKYALSFALTKNDSSRTVDICSAQTQTSHNMKCIGKITEQRDTVFDQWNDSEVTKGWWVFQQFGDESCQTIGCRSNCNGFFDSSMVMSMSTVRVILAIGKRFYLMGIGTCEKVTTTVWRLTEQQHAHRACILPKLFCWMRW